MEEAPISTVLGALEPHWMTPRPTCPLRQLEMSVDLLFTPIRPHTPEKYPNTLTWQTPKTLAQRSRPASSLK